MLLNRASRRIVGSLGYRPKPIIHILFGLILGKAVAFLNLALELFLPPINDVEVCTPFCPSLTAHLVKCSKLELTR
jgi:hypothetical protein